MSRDSQQRPPSPIGELTQLTRRRLKALGYAPELIPDILACDRCSTGAAVEIGWTLPSGEWSIWCAACDAHSTRSYADASMAIAHWNTEQINAHLYRPKS